LAHSLRAFFDDIEVSDKRRYKKFYLETHLEKGEKKELSRIK
jgi:hypothetical protein